MGQEAGKRGPEPQPEPQEGRVKSSRWRDPEARKPVDPRSLAARIVARAGREHPADELLRRTLSSREGLGPVDARWISRAVFCYFRWQCWLDHSLVLERRFDQAMGLADTFAKHPGRVSDAALAALAVPEWVAGALEVTPEWLRSLQREPVLWLRARHGTGPQVLTSLGGESEAAAGPLPDSLRYLGKADLFRDPVFRQGAFEIQDIASQAVGFVAAPSPGETWWDVCAGEGGKTLHLADLMQGRGLVMATDRAPWRIERLRRRAGRAQCFNYQARVHDAAEGTSPGTPCDGVLVDAPCSGVGTWGRNPHARWTTTPEDVAELAAIQGRLLAQASEQVKPGGRLVYAVCTVTREETVAVADAFGAAHPGFVPLERPDPFRPEAPPAARHLWWPQQTEGNGMFVATWSRMP